MEEELGEKRNEGSRNSVGMTAATESKEMGLEARAIPRPTCCICMEPWTCYNMHRIYCIPCGHVYGRSCLERWLHHYGGSSAKCPQCGKPFACKNIINLYAPGNLPEGCRRVQELQASYDSHIAMMEARFEELKKKAAELQSTAADQFAKLLASIQFAGNIETRVRGEFASMKEQMKKLIEDNNATPVDLIGFMDENGTKLWDWIPFQPRG